jgi:mitotic spindle assembly checkpoint protein MAD2
VNSILFQRGIYPSEEFSRVKKYGMTLLICQQENVKAFIETITAQLSNWLEAGNLERAVLVIASIPTKEVLERWNFTIETDTDAVHKGVTKEKSDKEIMTDIQAIMRQIASSVTFLPNLEEACTFDLLAYTSVDSKVPPTWGDSDARLIDNPQIVKLRSIDTKVHQVEALVAYKFNEEV